jgi:hypothetical protein
LLVTDDPSVVRDPAPWPPTPKDRFSGWLARRVARISGFRLGVAIFTLVVVWNALILVLVFVDHSDEEPVIVARYNDALVAADLESAWGLGCRQDRSQTSLDEFVTLYESAVAPLGGLESWGRLRGGPEWSGPSGSQQRVPSLTKVDGHWCVRLGGNPLGEPF